MRASPMSLAIQSRDSHGRVTRAKQSRKERRKMQIRRWSGPAVMQWARLLGTVAKRWRRQLDGAFLFVPQSQLPELIATPTPNEPLHVEHDSEIFAAGNFEQRSFV